MRLGSIKTDLLATAVANFALVFLMWSTVFPSSSSAVRQQDAIKSLRYVQAISDTMAALQALDMPGNDILEDWDEAKARRSSASARTEMSRMDGAALKALAGEQDLLEAYAAAKATLDTMVERTEAVFEAADRRTAARNARDARLQQIASTDAAAAMAQIDQTFSTMNVRLRAMQERAIQSGESRLDDSAAALRAAKRNSTLLLVVVTLVSFYMARRSFFRIADPLKRITDVIRAVALGDVGQTVPQGRGEGEIGQLHAACEDLLAFLRGIATGAARMAEGDLTERLRLRSGRDELSRSWNEMAERLTAMFQDLLSASAALSVVSSQVASSSNSLSQGTSPQAASVEEKQLASTAEEVARHASSLEKPTGLFRLARAGA